MILGYLTRRYIVLNETANKLLSQKKPLLTVAIYMGVFWFFFPLFELTAKSQTDITDHTDRGYLTSAHDLELISQQAWRGIEPYRTYVDEFWEMTGSPIEWEYGEIQGKFESGDVSCRSVEYPDGDRFISQQGGGHAVYQKMIAYHLSHNIEFARVARNKIMDLTTTYGFGGQIFGGDNQCIIYLAFAIPLWIQAADLLENEPIWSEVDKRKFQDWLKDEVYPKVAWASRVRRNNWGSAGSLTASMIADYLQDRDVLLTEIEPQHRELTPAQAYNEHNDMQLKRMNTIWKGDSRCDIWGIRPYGGIPDELRRGDTGCQGYWLTDDDDSYVYQVTQIDHLVFHAEFLRRRGETMIYDNMEVSGAGSLLNAILFVIDNPVDPDKSYNWPPYKIGILSVAYQYYKHELLRDEIDTASLTRGGMIAFAQLTHPLLDSQ